VGASSLSALKGVSRSARRAQSRKEPEGKWVRERAVPVGPLRVGDHEVAAVRPGSYLLKPRGSGPRPARLLEVIVPAYFAELAGAGDSGRHSELAAKYGLAYSWDWVPTLISRYHLKLLGH
jgi:hypothetical protein